MTEDLPEIYTSFRADYPEVAEAHDHMARALAASGPIDARTVLLVKLALAVGAQSEGSVRSNARQALAGGVSSAELEQVALMAIRPRGFPAAMAALGWIREVLPPVL